MAKFGELISAKVPILFYFYADWSEDCASMDRIIKNVSAAVGDKAQVIKINVDNNPQLCEALRIKGLPTMVIYKNNEMRWRQSGIQDPNHLINLVHQYR